jgi:hypothetical protein
MSKNKQFSSYYFVIFVAVAALILVWYFSYNDSTENNNINNANTTSQVQQQENKNINLNLNANNNSNVNSNENINTGIGGNEETSSLTSDLGISVTGYEINRTSSGDVVNLDLGENDISVMPTSYEGIVKNSISIQEEEDIVVAGVNGMKYTGGSAKDGLTVSFILVENNGKLYYFKGTDNFLNNLSNIINFN